MTRQRAVAAGRVFWLEGEAGSWLVFRDPDRRFLVGVVFDSGDDCWRVEQDGVSSASSFDTRTDALAALGVDP